MKKHILILIALIFYFDMNCFGSRPESEKLDKDVKNRRFAFRSYHEEFGVTAVEDLYRLAYKTIFLRAYNSNSSFYTSLIRNKVRLLRLKYSSREGPYYPIWLEKRIIARKKEKDDEIIRSGNAKKKREYVYRKTNQDHTLQKQAIKWSNTTNERKQNIKKESHGSMIMLLPFVALGCVVSSVYYLFFDKSSQEKPSIAVERLKTSS